MKKKLLKSLRVLLVAAGLGVGANAWADDEVYNFRSFIGGMNNNATLVKGSSVTVGESTMYLVSDFTQANYSILRDAYLSREFSTNGRFAVGSETWQLRRKTDVGYMIRPSSAAGTFAILNLNEGDKIVFDITTSESSDENTNESQITFTSTNLKVSGASENVTSGTSIVDGTTYEVTSEGYVLISLAQYVGFRQITITPNPDVETVSGPTITAVGANGSQRTIQISGGSTTKDGASIISYRYTMDGTTTPTASVGTLYNDASKPTITETTTFMAVAISSTGKASPATTTEIAAGTTLELAPVTYAITNMTSTTGMAYPVYTFTNNNSAVVGAPASTLTATFTPTGGVASPVSLTNNSYTFAGYGKLTVTATAEGYNSVNAEVSVTNLYKVNRTYDFTELTTDDMTPLGWEKVVDKTYYTGGTSLPYVSLANIENWQWRPGNGMYNNNSGGRDVTLKEANGGETALFYYYNNATPQAVVTYGTNIKWNMPRYNILGKIIVYEVAPANISVPVGTSGFATYANHDYALDFTGISGLTAFTAALNGTKDAIVFTPATQVPAGTGLLLMGETKDVPVIASADAIEGNLLYAPTTAITGNSLVFDDGTYENYILSQPSGKSVGFYKANGNNVAVGKAYLRIEKSADARQFSFIGFDGTSEFTGISAVESANKSTEGFYNLNGQRVSQPKSGLYIVNGKKVIVK